MQPTTKTLCDWPQNKRSNATIRDTQKWSLDDIPDKTLRLWQVNHYRKTGTLHHVNRTSPLLLRIMHIPTACCMVLVYDGFAPSIISHVHSHQSLYSIMLVVAQLGWNINFDMPTTSRLCGFQNICSYTHSLYFLWI